MNKLILLLIVLNGVLICQGDAKEVGVASWYGKELEGEYMANMKPFNPYRYTCASWNYPLGTKLIVTNLSNNRRIVVEVTDRGPNKRLNRVIDLSMIAFKQIEDLDKGLTKVKVERL